MEKKIEKQKFYISEFQEEAAWMAFMQREGWKFVSTDGCKYVVRGRKWFYFRKKKM